MFINIYLYVYNISPERTNLLCETDFYSSYAGGVESELMFGLAVMFPSKLV